MPEILVYENSDLLAEKFAEYFTQQAIKAVEERCRFLAVLSGGGTPLKAYRLLAESSLKKNVPWENVHLFWGDERFVSHDNLQSNFYQAREALLAHVNIPEGNLHPMPTNLPPDEAVNAYEQTLFSYAEASSKQVRFDLVLLGLGDDGHTASLFPGQSVLWNSPVILTKGSYQGRPAIRMTMTPMVFNHAREIIFLVSGESKADALYNTLNKDMNIDRFPAQAVVSENGSVRWMIDEDAAKI